MKSIKHGDLFIVSIIGGLFLWKIVPVVVDKYQTSVIFREMLNIFKWSGIILYTLICFISEYLRNSRYYVLKWNLVSLIIHCIDDVIVPFIKNKNKNNEKS